MIEYPDFTGHTVDEVQKILASEYPGAQCYVITYFPPRVKNTFTGSGVCRVIRQRMTDGRLELTVSPFRYNE